jgi:hypothetical protein
VKREVSWMLHAPVGVKKVIIIIIILSGDRMTDELETI